MKRRDFLKGVMVVPATAVVTKLSIASTEKVTKEITRYEMGDYSGHITDGKYTVHYDLSNGFYGMDYPVGLKNRPAGTMSDALNILKALTYD